MLLYKYEDPYYVLYDIEHGDEIFRYKEIAIGYSWNERIGAVMHKHGSPENVQKWIDKSKKAFIESGYPQMAEEFEMISGKFPIQAINNCIEITGFINRFLEILKVHPKVKI